MYKVTLAIARVEAFKLKFKDGKTWLVIGDSAFANETETYIEIVDIDHDSDMLTVKCDLPQLRIFSHALS